MIKVFNVLVVLFLNFSLAGQGDKGGNGGGGWVCQSNQNKKVKKIELFDFFEAESLYGLKIKKYSEKEASKFTDVGYQYPLTQYKIRISEIDSNLFKELAPYFKYFNNNLNTIGQDAELTTVHDLNSLIKPSARWCRNGTLEPKTIINFTDEGRIYLNKELFNHKEFSITEKAGLILHEVIYAYLRDKFGDQDSVDARLIVGVIASNLSVSIARPIVLDLIQRKIILSK